MYTYTKETKEKLYVYVLRINLRAATWLSHHSPNLAPLYTGHHTSFELRERFLEASHKIIVSVKQRPEKKKKNYI